MTNTERPGVVTSLLAWTPWVAAGAGAGVLLQGGFGTVLGMEPSASLVILGAALALWFGLRWWLSHRRATRLFGLLGLVVVAPVVWVTGREASAVTAGWLGLAFAGTVLLSAWGRNAIARHGGSQRASSLGGFVVFGQASDALTTAVGIDVLGYGEQNAISSAILSLAEGLPLSEVTGSSWLFIAVKLALAVAVVALFVDVGEESRENTLVVAVAAFAGFGPAVHNVVLFATT